MVKKKNGRKVILSILKNRKRQSSLMPRILGSGSKGLRLEGYPIIGKGNTHVYIYNSPTHNHVFQSPRVQVHIVHTHTVCLINKNDNKKLF